MDPTSFIEIEHEAKQPVLTFTFFEAVSMKREHLKDKQRGKAQYGSGAARRRL